MKSVGRIIRNTKSLWKRLSEHYADKQLIQAYKLVEAEYQRYIDACDRVIERDREYGLVDKYDIQSKEYHLKILKALQATRKVSIEIRHKCGVDATIKVYCNNNKIIGNIIKKIV